MKSQQSNKTIYGIKTLEKARRVHEKDRLCRCSQCSITYHLSNEMAPFFKARPDKEFDDYYCGCYGWD